MKHFVNQLNDSMFHRMLFFEIRMVRNTIYSFQLSIYTTVVTIIIYIADYRLFSPASLQKIIIQKYVCNFPILVKWFALHISVTLAIFTFQGKCFWIRTVPNKIGSINSAIHVLRRLEFILLNPTLSFVFKAKTPSLNSLMESGY